MADGDWAVGLHDVRVLADAPVQAHTRLPQLRYADLHPRRTSPPERRPSIESFNTFRTSPGPDRSK